MSMSYYYYIGPYIKCVAKNVSKIKTYKTCPNHKKTTNPVGKFCNLCGSKFVKIKEKTEEPSVCPYEVNKMLENKFNNYDILFEIRGECQEKLVHYYGPCFIKNKAVVRDFLFYKNCEGKGVVNPDVFAEKEWLQNDYSEEINALNKMYENVVVEWGIVVGYS